MTPNRFDVVQQVAAERGELLQRNTTETCAEFTRMVAARLHALDPGWGLLTKTSGEHQHQGFAIDAICYQPTLQVIDIIGGAEAGGLTPPRPGRPVWQEVPRRPHNVWAPPTVPPPGPQPLEPSAPAPQPPAAAPPDPRVDALLGAVRALQRRVEELEARAVERDDRLRQALARIDAAVYAARGLTLRAGALGTLSGTVGGPDIPAAPE